MIRHLHQPLKKCFTTNYKHSVGKSGILQNFNKTEGSMELFRKEQRI